MNDTNRKIFWVTLSLTLFPTVSAIRWLNENDPDRVISEVYETRICTVVVPLWALIVFLAVCFDAYLQR